MQCDNIKIKPNIHAANVGICGGDGGTEKEVKRAMQRHDRGSRTLNICVESGMNLKWSFGSLTQLNEMRIPSES